MTLDSLCHWGHPKQTAIEYQCLDEILCITYAEVDAARKTISSHLSGIKGSEFIGINPDVSGHLIPSLMLGIMTGGHAFVTLPPNAKASKHLLSSLCIRYQFICHATSNMRVLACINTHGIDIHMVKLVEMDDHVLNDNSKQYAYAISTSGSTGTPKIVRVPHSCIVPNILDLKEILHITKSDKIAQFTSLTFDPCIIEIFLALSAGATLYIVSELLKSDTDRLLRETCQNQVTVLQMTPSVLLHCWSGQSLNQSLLSRNSSLRVLLLGGERFPKVDLIFAYKHIENTTRIFNIYGITEVSCWASISEVENTSYNPRYLGNPLLQTMFQVQNETGQVVTNGHGLLFIGSNERICVVNDESVDELVPPVYRNTGDAVYINQGKVYYKGRKTSVVKRFGKRVDLTLLEKTMLEHDFVKTSYALWDDNSHKLYLCLIIERDMLKEIDQKVIIMNSLSKLDPICRPDKIKLFDSFCLTSNGKVCLEYLLKQCLEGKELIQVPDSRNPQWLEQIFQEAWTKYLGPGMNGFIELGGTSVVALQISQSLVEDFNHEFPKLIGMLLSNSTFSDCLNYIKNTLSGNQENFPIKNSKRRHSENEQIQGSSHAVVKRPTTQLSATKNTYHWQKCRGRVYRSRTDVPDIDTGKCETVLDARILFSHNLKKCIDASPTVFRYPDGNLCVTVGSHSGIICTVELIGKTPSTYEIKLPDRIEASVLILDDFRGVVGCYDHSVYCLGLKTKEIIWRFQTDNIVKCTAICSKDGNKIFLGSYDCHVYCLSAKEGAQIWKVKASTGSITASGCLHEPLESVLFGTLDGSCIALQQSSGEVIWKRRLSSPIFVVPTVLHSDFALFCTVAGVLTCFNVEEDTEIWNYSIDGNIFAYPIARYNPETDRETIVVASQNKNLYVLEVTNDGQSQEPTLRNVINFGTPIFATPWFNALDLFVICTDGTLSICKSSEANPRQVIKLPGDVFSSPVVHSEYMFVGCRDDNLYILELGGNANKEN